MTMLTWVWANAGDFSFIKFPAGVVSLNENDLLRLVFEYLAYSWWNDLGNNKKHDFVGGDVSLGLGLGFSKTHTIPNVLSTSCL